jgi:hypothetical protein
MVEGIMAGIGHGLIDDGAGKVVMSIAENVTGIQVAAFYKVYVPSVIGPNACSATTSRQPLSVREQDDNPAGSVVVMFAHFVGGCRLGALPHGRRP